MVGLPVEWGDGEGGGGGNMGEKVFLGTSLLPTTFLSTSLSMPIEMSPTRSVLTGLLGGSGINILLNGFFTGRDSISTFGDNSRGGSERESVRRDQK